MTFTQPARSNDSLRPFPLIRFVSFRDNGRKGRGLGCFVYKKSFGVYGFVYAGEAECFVAGLLLYGAFLVDVHCASFAVALFTGRHEVADVV
jgi:hypothetical protein